jgi:bifunctional UDP-N-acetylglucosamine pyrophosphorylase/glucosamine-1-phosphate N-acetyltransferase
MVIESFEQVEEKAARPAMSFRGRDSYFWKRRIFRKLEPYTPDQENKAELGFHFLIVFDPRRFLAIEPGGIDEIFKLLSSRDPKKDNIFSVEGKPFFAISRAAFDKLKFNLEGDKEVTFKLRNNGNVRLMNLRHRFNVLDLRKDWRIVEDMVSMYQVEALIAAGVIVEDMGNFYMEGMVPVGEGTRIASGVVIKGDSVIGKNVHIYPHCYIENSKVGDDCTLLPGCVMRDSELEQRVKIGPYTHLRAGALVKQDAKMGNFVEMKKSVLGEGSKAMHLAYVGDADVGKKVNIGAGAITCNYDGVNKHKTVIRDGAFIGSGTELVAPIVIEKNSYVAAGSTVNEDVPEDSLAVARQKQRNIEGWVTRKQGKKS